VSKVVLLDCDGPLLDFVGGICAAVNRRANHRAGVRGLQPAQVQTWDVFRYIDPVIRDDIRAEVDSPTFWAGLKPVPDAELAVERFRAEGWQVLVVTSPWERCFGWETVRRHMLGDLFGFDPRDIIVTARKEHDAGDIFIDDKPEHVDAWSRRNTFHGARLYSMPHNQNSVSRNRPNNECWGEFTWKDVDQLIAAHRETPL